MGIPKIPACKGVIMSDHPVWMITDDGLGVWDKVIKEVKPFKVVDISCLFYTEVSSTRRLRTD